MIFFRSKIQSLLSLTGLKYDLLWSSIWATLAFFSSQSLILVTNFLSAKFLGAEEYGVFSILISSAQLISLVSTLGLHIILPTQIAQSDNEHEKREMVANTLWITRALAIAIILVTVLFNRIAIEIIIGEQSFFMLFMVSTLLFFTYTESLVQTAIFSGFKKFDILFKSNVIKGGLVLLGTLLGAYYWGLNGTVFGFTGSSITSNIVGRYFIKKHLASYSITYDQYKKIAVNPAFMKAMKLAIPALKGSFVVIITNWLLLRLIIQYPNGFHETGVYNIVNQIKMLLLFLPSTLGFVLTPLLSSGDKLEKQIQMVLWVTGIIVGVNLVTGLFIYIYATEILGFFGNDYLQNEETLNVIVLTTIINASVIPMGNFMVAKGKLWLAFLFNSLWAIVQVVIAILLLEKDMGALGVAYASLISYVLHLGWTTLFFISYCYKKRSTEFANDTEILVR
ncbi:MAG: oligosaccharide flippase family protein [Bacteroidota bacterium]